MQVFTGKFQKWSVIRASLGDVLAWVAWMACFREWRARVLYASVGGVLAV